MIAAWVHDEPHFPNAVLERSRAAIRLAECVTKDKRPNLKDVEELLGAYEENLFSMRELAMIGAALIHCWGNCAGIPAPTLLADIALGQAFDPA